MNYEVVEVKTTQPLSDLWSGSACTMLGYLPKELELYIKQLREHGFLKDEKVKVYTYKGSLLNKFCHNPEAFPEDLNIFSIDLNQMENVASFALSLRLQMGYRWLDDIYDNNKEEPYEN